MAYYKAEKGKLSYEKAYPYFAIDAKHSFSNAQFNLGIILYTEKVFKERR